MTKPSPAQWLAEWPWPSHSCSLSTRKRGCLQHPPYKTRRTEWYGTQKALSTVFVAYRGCLVRTDMIISRVNHFLPSWLGKRQARFACSQQRTFPSLERPLLVTSRYIIQAGVFRSGPSGIFWSNLTLKQDVPPCSSCRDGEDGWEGEKGRG